MAHENFHDRAISKANVIRCHKYFKKGSGNKERFEDFIHNDGRFSISITKTMFNTSASFIIYEYLEL